jgi:hypothetical protein
VWEKLHKEFQSENNIDEFGIELGEDVIYHQPPRSVGEYRSRVRLAAVGGDDATRQRHGGEHLRASS